MGNDAEDIYESFTCGEKEVQTLEVVLNIFVAYFLPRCNLTYERHIFFLLALRRRAKQKKSEICEFGAMRDDLIKDSNVCGIRDNTLRQRLLREHNLTLIQAIDTCRTVELIDKRLKMFQEEAAAVQEVVTCSNVRLRNSGLQNKDTFRLGTDRWCFNCDKCGIKHEHRKCLAYGEMCRKCNGQKVREVTKTSSMPSSSEDNFVVAEVNISGPASVAAMATSNRPSCECKNLCVDSISYKSTVAEWTAK
ncbi:hypothetical protein PR048_011350 [Dryococelus australis]|uniref:Uncharacterized protein n=1 Tax=Dryococelus australis TaxID=614101 RepID=A0ABQ9HLB9_9NEOP|nr:hypothetical protein PR048_011350 [Dryococelus australis]